MHCLDYARASGTRFKIIASANICGLAATTTFCICPVEDRQGNDSSLVAHSNFAVGPAQPFEGCYHMKVVLVQKLHLLSPVPVGTASALGQCWIATKSVSGKSWAAQWWVETPKSPKQSVAKTIGNHLWPWGRSVAIIEKQCRRWKADKGRDGAWSEAVNNQTEGTIKNECSVMPSGGREIIQFQLHCQSTKTLCFPFV